jgi:tetratricopeptide (TPR) repeat protein
MTQQGAMPRILLFAGLALGLIVIAVYLYQADRLGAEQQTEDAMATMEFGIQQFQRKQFRESLETLGGISEDTLQHWRIHYYMGSSHVMLRDNEAAAAQFEKALALKPDEPKTLYALGVAYYKLDNLGLSKAYFGKVLEYDPGNADARGLMDIVASLERKRSEEGEQAPPQEAATQGEGEPPVDSTDAPGT